MICPKCNGSGKVKIYDGIGTPHNTICDWCDGAGEYLQTNEEWFCTLTTEEKAEWLSKTFDLCGAGCSKCFVKELCFNEHINKMPSDLIVEWLKQPHTEKE